MLRTPSTTQKTNTALQASAAVNRAWRANFRRCARAHLAPSTAISHTTKALANGAAARWQGYAARLGLGMTRTRNHIKEHMPPPRKAHREYRWCQRPL